VDAVQFEARRVNYDFDMIEHRWDQSLSPRDEQTFYWGSAVAVQPGTRNYMGIKSAAVDAVIAALLKAKTRPDFVAGVRALDPVLISGFYTIPLFQLPDEWIARWTRIGRLRATSLYGYLPETWWSEPKHQ
jgi:peptide/nickel transport system substrate-binding protein